jgi:hypothetical protein
VVQKGTVRVYIVGDLIRDSRNSMIYGGLTEWTTSGADARCEGWCGRTGKSAGSRRVAELFEIANNSPFDVDCQMSSISGSDFSDSLDSSDSELELALLSSVS